MMQHFTPALHIYSSGLGAGQGDDVIPFCMLTVWLRRAVRQTAVHTNIPLLSRLEQCLKKTCQSKHPGMQTCAGIDPSLSPASLITITKTSFTEHCMGMNSVKCVWTWFFWHWKAFYPHFSLKKLLNYTAFTIFSCLDHLQASEM